MLEKAGVKNIVYEFEQWSKPEMFWKIRKDRDVKHWFFTMTIPEKLTTLKRIFARYGLTGVLTVMKNERVFYRTVLQGKLGYALLKVEKYGFGFCLPPLWKINNRVFQLENGTLEYHHLSPSSANVTEESNYYKYS